jgi:hypothetical protein
VDVMRDAWIMRARQAITQARQLMDECSRLVTESENSLMTSRLLVARISSRDPRLHPYWCLHRVNCTAWSVPSPPADLS